MAGGIGQFSFGEFNADEWDLTPKQSDDKEFKDYLDNKYPTDNDARVGQFAFGKFNPEEIEKAEGTPLEQQRKEYEEQKAKKLEIDELLSTKEFLGNTDPVLKFRTKNLQNNKSKEYFAWAYQGKGSIEMINKNYETRMRELAQSKGVSLADLEEWERRANKGHITETAGVLADMLDVAKKTGVAYLAGGAVGGTIGAIAGAPAGGAGAAPGAIAGAKIGADITASAGSKIAIFQDSFVKETGSFIEDAIARNPDMTPEEFEKVKKVGIGVGIANASIETSIASIFVLPAVGKLALKIPGAKKVTAKLFKETCEKQAKELPKLLSTEGGKAFVKQVSKLVGAEIGQEDLQEASNMIGEALTGETFTGEEVTKRIVDTSYQTFQASTLLSLVGGSGAVRVRNKVKQVNETVQAVNAKIDEVNAANQAQKEAEAGATTKAEGTKEGEKPSIQTMTPEALKTEKAQQDVKAKEIEGAIQKTQAKIDSAKDLGINEEEKAQLEQEVQNLQKQKDEAVDAYKAINTEEAVRQAQETNKGHIAKVNTAIEQATNAMNKTMEQVKAKQKEVEAARKEYTKASKKNEATAPKLKEKMEKAKKQLSDLKTKVAKQEKNIGTLETKQEQLLTTQAKLDNRIDVEGTLKGMKTTLPARRVVKMEQRIQEAEAKLKEAIQQGNTKMAAKINKLKAKQVKEKINSFVQGFKSGAKGQEQETRDVRKIVSNALRSYGIKRSELGSFDSILKKIVTITDLAQRQEELTAKVEEVFEKRNKTIALEVAKNLEKKARPYKGQPPRGKMTAVIQRKVSRLFYFAQKTALEAGADIKALVDKYTKNPEAKVEGSEFTQLAKSMVNEAIIQANKDITELKAKEKEARKAKQGWKGEETDRADSVTEANVEEKVKGIDNKSKSPKEKVKEVKQELAKALNYINMGIKVGDLFVIIEGNLGRVRGSYRPRTKELTISNTSVFAISHEIGHYLDHKIAGLFGLTGLDTISANLAKMKTPEAKRAAEALRTLLNTEITRIQKEKWFKYLSDKDQKYLLRPTEIFARVFQASMNDSHKITLENTKSAVEEITDKVPATTIKDLKNFLNEIAYYKEYGSKIEELNNRIKELENQEKVLNKTETKEAIAKAKELLPEDIAELVEELSIASDLKNRTSEEIMNFNNYVAQLIQEGRDINQEKREARKKEKAKNVEELREAIQKYAKTKTNGKGVAHPVLQKFFGVISNWQGELNILFGKALSDKWNLLKEDTAASAFISEKKQQFMDRVTEIYGYSKGLRGMFHFPNMINEYLKQEVVVPVTVRGEQAQEAVNRMNAIGYYIYSKNEEGQARLNYKFSPEAQAEMFGMLSEEDKQLAKLCIEMADNYDLINSVFSEERGIDLPKRNNYFPFISEREEYTVASFLEDNLGFRVGLPSFTKSAVTSEKIELKPINPVTILFNHLDKVGHYINTYQKTKMISETFMNSALQHDIGLLYGSKIRDEFNNTIMRLAFGGAESGSHVKSDAFSTWMDNFIVGNIALKPTIALKQMLSFINYAEKMPVAYFTKYVAEFATHPAQAIKFMMEDKYLQARFREGSQTVELAHAIESSKFSKTRSLSNFFTLNVRIGDMGAIVFGGYAMVKYLMNEKGLSKKEAFEAFRVATAESQQFSSDASLSNLQAASKRNPLARGLLAFTNTPYQYLNKIINVVYQAKRGEISKQQAAKTVFIYQVLNPWMYNAATSLSPLKLLLAYMYGDDDDVEEAMRELFLMDGLGGFLTGNMNVVPINMPELLFREAMGEKVYEVGRIPWAKELKSMGITAIEFGKEIRELIQGERDLDDLSLEDYVTAVTDFVQFSKGLPTRYAGNVVSGAQDLLPAVGGDDEIRPLNATLKFAGYTKKKSESVTGKYGL